MNRARIVICVAFAACALLLRAHADTRIETSLCSPDEKVVFSCSLQKSTKMVALCSSKQLTKEKGYLQYRFGLPEKVELEFPQSRDGSSQRFLYHHYFRAQVDETEISFKNDGAEYTVFSDYNGEEKPAISQQGVRVTPAGSTKEVTLTCKGRASASFENLEGVLPQSVE